MKFTWKRRKWARAWVRRYLDEGQAYQIVQRIERDRLVFWGRKLERALIYCVLCSPTLYAWLEAEESGGDDE